MDTEKKTCIKCGKELPKNTDNFRKSHFTTDGFEGQCKNCKKKYFKDYRAGKRVRSKSKKPAQKGLIRRKITGLKRVATKIDPGEPLRSATPAEIVVALRKGMAAEIVAMINEKYEL